MPTDLTVILENRPGTIAELGEATGRAGINIDGACGFPSEGRGVMHILVEDGAAARAAIEEAGFEVRDEREVMILRQGVDIEDRPGTAGELFRRMADAGVNVDLLYGKWNGDVVIGADDIQKAQSAVRGEAAGAM